MWELILVGGVVLPLLVLDLVLTRRSQRRDREKAASEAARHAEGQHRLDAQAAEPRE